MENHEEKKEIIVRIKLLEINNSAAVINRVSNALNVWKTMHHYQSWSKI